MYTAPSWARRHANHEGSCVPARSYPARARSVASSVSRISMCWLVTLGPALGSGQQLCMLSPYSVAECGSISETRSSLGWFCLGAATASSQLFERAPAREPGRLIRQSRRRIFCLWWFGLVFVCVVVCHTAPLLGKEDTQPAVYGE